MYISQLLPNAQTAQTSLITSIIEPDEENTSKCAEFIIKKIPLADKVLIKEYEQRIKREYFNTPRLKIIHSSEFYLTVYLEKAKKFEPIDLIQIPFSKRAKLLADTLKGVIVLSKHYGYFYLTEKMLSYDTEGQINVWINQDYFCNKPQHVINHGRFSEEIFVADFKQTFGGNFQGIKQFRKARNMGTLLEILNRGQDIYHSMLMSEPVSKESFIQRKQTLKFSNFFNSNMKENIQEQIYNHKGLKQAESLRNIAIDFNSQSLDEVQNLNEQGRKLTPTLSSPGLIKINSANKKHTKDNSRNNYGSLTSQNLPKINFTYSSKQAWKRKHSCDGQKEGHLLNFLKIRHRGNDQSLIRESQNNLLKVSFPNTTTHSFSSLTSFGSMNSQSQQAPQITQRQIQLKVPQITQRQIQLKALQITQRQIQLKDAQQQKCENKMEYIDEMQTQFENLFQSDLVSSQQQLQNLQVIMQQFENILQG